MKYWFTVYPKTVVGCMPEYPGMWAIRPTALQCFQSLQQQFGDYILYKTFAKLTPYLVLPTPDTNDYYFDLSYNSRYNCYIAQDLVYTTYQVKAKDAETAISKFFQGYILLKHDNKNPS